MSLQYSSGTPNGWCGVGWNLDLGQIQRDGSRGVPILWNSTGPTASYDDADGFTFSLNGQGSKLVQTGTGSGYVEYRAENERAYLRFRRFTTGAPRWEVVDRSGTQYFFGEAATSRMEHPTFPQTGTNAVFRWCLSRVVDVHGNQSTYTYVKNGNQTYPAAIAYNESTVGGGIPACFRVVFTLADRTDDSFAYSTGYRVEQNKLLSRIDVLFDDPGSSTQPVRAYQLYYAASPSTGRSLLDFVQLFGTSGPPIVLAGFDYSVNPRSFAPTADWGPLVTETAGQTGGEWRSPTGRTSGSNDLVLCDLVDWDGDGRPDRMSRRLGPQILEWRYQRNTGTGFTTTTYSTGFLENEFGDSMSAIWNSISYTNDSNDTRSGLWDIDGDGYVDRLLGDATPPYGAFLVQKNVSGTGLVPYLSDYGSIAAETIFDWNNIVNRNSDSSPATTYDLIDLDGDGRADRLSSDPAAGGSGTWRYRRNTGTGFEPPRNWPGVASNGFTPSLHDMVAIAWSDGAVETHVSTADINGDGLTDRVCTTSSPTKNHFQVQYNNGAGFEPFAVFPGLITGSSSPDWGAPLVGAHGDTQALLMDMNGDGLPDRVTREIDGSGASFDTFRVQFNTGTGFGPVYDWGIESGGHPDYQWSAPVEGEGVGSHNLTRATLIDIDGNGLPDRVLQQFPAPHNVFEVELNEGPYPDLLTNITTGLEGEVSIEYRPSTELDNKDHQGVQRLPFPVQVVKSVTTNDGRGLTGTTNYSFSGGFFHAQTREFRGFHRAEEIDPDGLKGVTYFHQGGGYDSQSNGEWSDAGSHAKKGMPYRSEVWGSDGQLYKASINKVDEVEVTPGTGRWFAYVSQTVELDYEGNTSGLYRATAKRFLYDTTLGNLARVANHGKVTNVNVGQHQFQTACSVTNPCTYEYYLPSTTVSNPDVTDKIGRVILTDNDVVDPITQGHKLRETVFTHVATTGDVLSKSEWLDLPSPTYITEVYEYDIYGNVDRVTDSQGVVKTISYADADGIHSHAVSTSILAQDPPRTFTTSRTPDPRTGFDLIDVDVKGLVTETDYDAFFRVRERRTVPTTGAPIWRERYEYSLGGMSGTASLNRVTSKKNDAIDLVDGIVQHVYYDGLGRSIQTRAESETAANAYRVADVAYDASGRTARTYRPYLSNGTAFTETPGGTGYAFVEYDEVGRPWRTTPPPGDTGSPTAPETIEYEAQPFDPSQWTTITTDAKGMRKEVRRDAYGRVTSVTTIAPGLSATVGYGYDLLGRLDRVQHDPTHATVSVYDSLGRKLSGVDPDMGAWSFAYDSSGNLIEQLDAKNQRTVTDYDDLKRPKSVTIHAADGTVDETITYAYDVSDTSGFTAYYGQLFKVTDGEGWEKNSYDLRGRMLKTARRLTKTSTTYTTSFTYDDADRVIETVYPRTGLIPVTPGGGGPYAQVRVRNTYDSAGHLLQIDRLHNATVTEMLFRAPSFDALDMPNFVEFGNGVRTDYEYHANSRRMSRILTTSPLSGVVQDMRYQYDALGQIMSLGDFAHGVGQTGEVQGVLYDGLHRLRSFTRGGVTTTFDYDALCNITQNAEYGPGTYGYDPVRLHAVTSIGGAPSFAYDANGNMTDRGTQDLGYDAANRLAWVLDGPTRISYGYDHAGGRLWRQKGNQTTVWIGGLYEERNGMALNHVFAGTRRICTLEHAAAIAPPPQQSPSYDPVFYYVHPDHLGSANVLTDRIGGEVQHYENKAYGAPHLIEDPSAVALLNRFTDQAYDADAELYLLGTRYYDPRLGRFLQPDFLTPDVLDPFAHNRYAYALGNPLRFTDPTGNFSFIPILIGAILGGVTAAIQHEDIGKGILTGAITGAFGQFGTIGRAVGGAANAAIQGGNPLLGATIGAVFGRSEFKMIQNFARDFAKSGMGSLVTNVRYHATNQLARKMTSRLAVHVGWDPMLFNAAMMAGSHVGNKLVGSRVVPPASEREQGEAYFDIKPDRLAKLPGAGIVGILNRGILGAPFDAIDCALAAQGMHTASSLEFYENYKNAANAWGHSLGSMDMANLTALGRVPGSTLWGVPLAKAAPWDAAVQLGDRDFISTGNFLVNWQAKYTHWSTRFFSSEGHDLNKYVKHYMGQ